MVIVKFSVLFCLQVVSCLFVTKSKNNCSEQVFLFCYLIKKTIPLSTFCYLRKNNNATDRIHLTNMSDKLTSLVIMMHRPKHTKGYKEVFNFILIINVTAQNNVHVVQYQPITKAGFL